MSFVPLRYFFLLTVLLSCSPGATREIEPFYAEVEQAFVQVRTGQTDMEETSKRLLDKAEKLFGKDSGPVAGLRHDLGWLHREFGNHAAAEEHFKQAIELQDRAAEDDDTIGAAFRFSLAELYRDAGRYDVSETFYKKSLDVLDKRPRESVDLETVHVLNGLGLLYKELGRLPEAESYFLRAMEKIESVRESCRPEYASLVNNLALVYLDQGRYGEAETLYKQLISDGESEDFAGPEDTIHLLNNLALLYCNQGRYDDAEPLYRKSLEIIARHSKADRRRETVVLVNLSLLHANRKRFDESETAANDALHSITEEPPENSPLYPSVMHAFSTCYFRQGRKEEAEEYARKALDFFRKRAQHDQGAAHHGATATAMNNLAKILFDLRRYPEAEPLFDQAIVLLENRVSRPDSVALVYNNRARLFKALGRRDEAVRDLKKSLELSSEARKKVSGTDEQRAETFSRQYFLFARMVDWQYEFGNMEEAYEAMERSRAQGLQDLIQSHGIDLLQGVSPDLAERLRLETTIAQGAVKSLERQLEHLERKGETDQPEKTSEIRESKRLLKDAQKRLVEAWAAIKDASPAYRMMMGSDRKPVPLAAIREELEMEKGIALEYQIGREKSYVLVYGVGFPAKLFPLRLDKEQAAIFNVPEGFLTSESLDRILLGNEKTEPPAVESGSDDSSSSERAVVPYRPSAGGESKRGLLTTITDINRVPANGALDAETISRLAALWKILVPDESLRKRLTGENRPKRLLILPDGSLARLPFEMLVVESESRNPLFLLDRGPQTVYAPSASMYYNLKRRKSKTSDHSVLTVGNPDYSTVSPVKTKDGALDALRSVHRYGGHGKFKPLPWTDRESLWIEDSCRRHSIPVHRLVGTEATEFNVKNHLEGRETVHLACHGISEDGLGNAFGALALTPGDLAEPGNDGFLTLAEMLELDLKTCELMILSACETNLGPNQHGEGTWSMGRGMMAAGARRVVTTDWQVADDASAYLISRFVENLNTVKQSGTPDFAESLHRARLHIRSGQENSRWRHPYFWAPFILMGPD